MNENQKKEYLGVKFSSKSKVSRPELMRSLWTEIEAARSAPYAFLFSEDEGNQGRPVDWLDSDGSMDELVQAVHDAVADQRRDAAE